MILCFFRKKIWNFQKEFVSLQRERWNQVEPRCAERWHGCSNAEMMSNSTLPLGFINIATITSRGVMVAFYTLCGF